MKLASLQPSVTVAKGKISFATMSHGCKGYFPLWTVTDGCKEANIMEFSLEYGILDTISSKFSLKMWFFLLLSFHKINLLQPSVMVAKAKIFLATMTHGYKAVKVLVIFKKLGLINEFGKKGQIHFSFFKIDSQNPKCNLEYLKPKSTKINLYQPRSLCL